MNDNEVRSRVDMLEAPPPPRGTLPPSAKTIAVVMAGLERLAKEIWLPTLPLVAVKLGILDPKEASYAFTAAMSFVLGGHFGLRKPGSDER